MSKNLSAVASEQFDSEVKHVFQTAGTLNGTCTVRMDVTGDTYNFRKMGKGLATQRTAPSADSIAMDVEHSLIPVTLTDWDADEYTDIFNAKEVNIDEVRELGYTIASALGRRRDQIKIDAMAAGSYSATPTAGQGYLVGTDVGGVGTGWNIEKLRATKKALDNREVPNTDRHVAITPDGLEDLLAETEVTSADYNSVKALVQGEVNTFMGFTFHLVAPRSEGGMSKTGNLQDNYAWHMSAIGEAVGMDITTGADWIAHKKSWLSHGEFKGGSVIRDNEGVVKIQTTED
jgi:hypothetical protein